LPRYEWRGDGGFRDNRNDRVVEPGETVALDEHVGGPHPELVRVGDDDDGDADDDSQPDTVAEATEEYVTGDLSESELEGRLGHALDEPPFDPSECTVDELRERLDRADYHAVEYQQLRDAERSGQNRTTAVKAILSHTDD